MSEWENYINPRDAGDRSGRDHGTGSGKPSRLATDPSVCRSCGAEVFWVVWKKSGKRMPVDSIPDQVAGNVLLVYSPKDNVLYAEHLADAQDVAGRKRYVSHFVACPQASQHRRSR